MLVTKHTNLFKPYLKMYLKCSCDDVILIGRHAAAAPNTPRTRTYNKSKSKDKNGGKAKY